MLKKTLGKTYRVYDTRTSNLSLADTRILLTTPNQQEALDYASTYNAAVYAYDIGKDGALSNAMFIYHLAKFMG